MKRVAVVGARGMLGHAVSEYFSRAQNQVVRIGRAEYDIARDPLEELERRLGDSRYVINCAGVIKPRVAETSVEDVLKVNAIFPRNLARLCTATDRRLFHVTTDCAYSGSKGGYTEADYFDAEDVYGLSKNAGDAADCMVLRTSILGEEEGQSRSLLEWARSQAGKSVNGFTNHRWNGVTTVYLAEIIDRIIDEGLYERGIFHIHTRESLDKFELLSLIDEVYGLRLKITPTTADSACDRCLGSIHPLSSKVCTQPLHQQIAEMRRFFEA